MSDTTLDLPLAIMHDLKRLQEQEAPGKSLNEIAAELISLGLGRRRSTRPDQTFRWTTHDMGPPRIALEDKEALWAALDEGTLTKLGR